MARSMHYCEWRNSLIDMRDIRDRLNEIHSPDQIENKEELEAYEKVIEMCRQIGDDFF